jgi:tetratricopeptide (TPR) repeat protein
MQLIPSMELNRRTTASKDQGSAALAATDRLIELSSWMMVLATARLVCSVADYTSTFLESMQGNALSLRFLSRYFQENQPFFALGIVWPLILAVALRKTRWPELLKAIATTFLVLSCCGLLESVAVWAHTRSTHLTVGSFHFPRRALQNPFFSEVVLCLLGTSQLLLEFGVSVWSLHLAHQFRRRVPVDSNKQQAARKARFGRLAVFASLAFFVLVIRSSIWPAYLEVLNQSSIVREFVLRNDFDRIHSRRYRPRNAIETEQEHRIRDVQTMFETARRAWEQGQFTAARHAYLQLLSRIDSIPQDSWTAQYRYTVGNAFNNLAWLYATCADPRFRDPQGAIKCAKRAVEIAPTDRNCWNTLGVAYYRAGDLEEAKNALYRSMEMYNEGDCFDWFFLAPIHFKLGHKDRAREWYDRAVRRFSQIEDAPGSLTRDQVDELYRFEVEAAAVLGLAKPAPPTPMIRSALCWTGAEAVGVPIPAMPITAARLPQFRSFAAFNPPFRMSRRTSPSPLVPAAKPQAGR